jgi:hypothetical protein
VIDEKLKEFARKYNATVNRSSRMYRRASYSNATSVGLPSDVFDNINYGDVACVEIHMPEYRFRALVEHDNWLQRAYVGNFKVGHEAANLVKQYERECIVRHENSAVQDAYEKYQLLLRMVESNYQ